MKFQTTPYSCGPAAIVNALRCLGIKAKEKEVRKAAGTTPKHGTDSAGILAAVNLWAQGVSFDTVGFDNALAWAMDEYPVIICVNGWDHWATVIGTTYGGNYIVADPSTGRRNRSENGIRICTRDQLKKLWAHGRTYSGVAVKPT